MNNFDALRMLGAPSEDRETAERTEETERLAALFLQALPQALNDRLGITNESSESWQGGVGELTQPAPLAPMCAEVEGGEPSTDKVLADTPAARHPFAGGAEG